MMVVVFYIFYIFVWLIAWLPLPVLYVFSYPIYFIGYYVVKYRRGVVRTNLRNSYLEKSEKELIDIEKRFYLFFADVVVETLKLVHISDDEMRRRMHFTNPEALGDLFEKGRSALILLAHYGSWEWSPSLYLNYDGVVGAELYRPIREKHFNEFFLKLRSRFGTITIPKNSALRGVANLRKEGNTFGLGLIADQTPSHNNLHFWTNFLNQDTPFLNGAERIARMAELAVVYMDIQRVGRGYYSCKLVVITENAKNEEENMVTEKFARLTEQTINRDPAYWLWSHRRWKHKREEVAK